MNHKIDLSYKLLIAYKGTPCKIRDEYFNYNKKSKNLFSSFILFLFIPFFYIISMIYFFTIASYTNNLYLTISFFVFLFATVFFILRFIWRFFSPIEQISQEEYVEKLETIKESKKLKNKKIIKTIKVLPLAFIILYIIFFFINIVLIPDFKGANGYFVYSKNKEYMGILVNVPNGIDSNIIVRTKDNTILSFAKEISVEVPEDRILYNSSDWFNYKIEKSPNGEKQYIPISFTPASYPYLDYEVKMGIPVPLKDKIYTWLVLHLNDLKVSDLKLIDREKLEKKWREIN